MGVDHIGGAASIALSAPSDRGNSISRSGRVFGLIQGLSLIRGDRCLVSFSE